ncbi:glycoside hydrolase family 32 protein [Dictyobacter aurantiacus]|uniref:beta-fructofuranosidase n=1 Tax=Dictyobacter aurantiacus TaxID=1936993 RepID=A0A401ZJ82_9CHLR|nr:glycoside hydrolase family 32 protein [Dictyobacter aurantiacus]GCE06899.1 glycosyl hydrolase family 32 [Dictyobacter aurantiacus]
MQRKHLTDHHRTAYHFQAPSNWMNDPNGLVQWKGNYHLFYQYHPHGPLFGKIHWGHAMSADLLHWTHLPIALSPTEGGPDEDGCWSGCIVNNQGVATIVYSGNAHGRQLPCVATSQDDDLRTWHKYAGNPVVADWPAELDIVEFRDHCVWQEGEMWYQVIGSGFKGVGGAALLYRSPDLLRWEYLQPLCVGNKDESGTMWECPDFFPLGDKHLLTVSSIPDGLVYYFIGSYQNFTFTPESQGLLDGGRHFYAPQSMRDDQGRRLMFGWLREGRDDTDLLQAGWAGAMSLPRILSLQPGGTLGIEPASEIEQLRLRRHTVEPQTITGQQTVVEQLFSNALEINLDIDSQTASSCGLILRDSAYPEESIAISLQEMGLNIEANNGHTAQEAEQYSLVIGRHTLRIFLDGSVLEVFIDGRACLTERFYHSAPQQLNLSLFASGGEATLHQMDVWEMDTIWQ